jgi:hypothetical protein
MLFETGGDVIADEPSYLTGVKRTIWDGPLLRVVFSPADNVELDLEWVAAVAASGEPGGDTLVDAGDVTLRAKWRLFGGKSGGAGLAVRFGVSLPNTSFNDTSGRPSGLGPDTTRSFAQALYTQPLGRARLHANAGILIFDEVFRPHEQSDFVLYGLALGVPLGGSFEAVAEVAGRGGEGEPGADERAEARAGLRFGSGRVCFDLAVRRGLLETDGTWGGTIGFAWTIKRGNGLPRKPHGGNSRRPVTAFRPHRVTAAALDPDGDRLGDYEWRTARNTMPPLSSENVRRSAIWSSGSDEARENMSLAFLKFRCQSMNASM